MNRKELVGALANKTGLSNAAADSTLAAIIETISDSLKNGENVTLAGFGTFGLYKRQARKGRNFRTGMEFEIKAAKVPAFIADFTFKTSVNT